MLRALRQSRALALTLLLAVPGLGGTWLSLAHPCPVDSPWLTQGEHQGHGSHGHVPAGQTSCHCVGACHGGAAPLVPTTAGFTTVVIANGWTTARTSTETDPPVQLHLHRQPPATAPPLA